ncbi:MAG: prepilin peptidase [Candidatus Berkelbacteria bacterium]
MPNLLIVTILGLIIGSFLNVIILRFDDLKSVLVGRSHCPKCKKDLVWFELIPVLSFVLLWGKCSKCKVKISWQYPLVEAGTALVFALIYTFFGFSLISLFLALISCLLIVALVYDILYLEISDSLILIAAGLWLVYLLIFHFDVSILNYIYGALTLGGFLGVMVFVSKEKWMGEGDIWLGALLGFILGWPNILVGSFLAFFIGAIVGIVLLVLKVSKLKDQLAFAPFLILGFWIALFWGEKIISWYMSLL